MHIVQLIAELKFVDARLQHSLGQNVSPSRCADMLRQGARLMDVIERHQPASKAELDQQVSFFKSRAARGPTPEARKRDADIAVDLLNRFKTEFDFGTCTEPSAREHPAPLDDRLAIYVSRSVERLVAIDRRYMYMASSKPNALFNGTHQVGMVDRHLADVVGRTRFEARARSYVDKCFEGTVQEYYYDLDTENDGTRIIRCQMKPVHDEIGQLYCGLMYMTDITGMAMSQSLR